MSELDGRFATKIRKPLRKWFFGLPNKGVLVNDLLELYLKGRSGLTPLPPTCQHGYLLKYCKECKK